MGVNTAQCGYGMVSAAAENSSAPQFPSSTHPFAQETPLAWLWRPATFARHVMKRQTLDVKCRRRTNLQALDPPHGCNSHSSSLATSDASLKFGAWSFSGCWSLVLGASLPFAILCLPAALTSTARAETDSEALECSKSASFLAPLDSPDRFKYAADREVEVIHLALTVTPDFKQRTIQATPPLRFNPIPNPSPQIKLPAFDLTI